MTQEIDAQVDGMDALQDAFERGWNAACDVFGYKEKVEDYEGVKTLAAGSLVKDNLGRVVFKTKSNGWIGVDMHRYSSMYLVFPLEVVRRG